MRKHPGKNHRRRPELDWLEGRRLLTDVIGGIATAASSPALLAPTRRQVTVADEPHAPLAISPAVRTDTETVVIDGDELAAERAGSVGKLQATTAAGRTPGPFVVARTSFSEAEAGDRDEELALSGPMTRQESWVFSSWRSYERPASVSPAVFRLRLALAPTDSDPEANDSAQLNPDETPPRLGALTVTQRVLDGLAAPRPRGLGLIDHVLPFSQDSLNRAVDRIFDEFERLAPPASLQSHTASKFVPPLALALAGAGLEVARRRLREAADDGHEERSRGPYATFGRHDLPGMPRF